MVSADECRCLDVVSGLCFLCGCYPVQCLVEFKEVVVDEKAFCELR
jgi:hypothetical protein